MKSFIALALMFASTTYAANSYDQAVTCTGEVRYAAAACRTLRPLSSPI